MTHLMPTLFLAHGSPMNALGKNPFAKALIELGQRLPKPKSILCISAHWRTNGPLVLKKAAPETIYDFGGFPPELSQITYPAPGAESLADRVAALLKDHNSQTTEAWGFDHGTWSVLRHLYPDASIPLTQLGITKRATLRDHWHIANALTPLRSEGVLVIGSGNITHNLGDIDWSAANNVATWAESFDQMIATALEQGDLKTLMDGPAANPALWSHAHPTLEHYIPLLYAYGAHQQPADISYPYLGIEMGTLSMRCVLFA